jgi:hypothetical protein
LHSAKKNTRENIILAEKFIDITNQIYEYLDNKYCILFKGSNGMKLYYHINEYINKEKSL